MKDIDKRLKEMLRDENVVFPKVMAKSAKKQLSNFGISIDDNQLTSIEENISKHLKGDKKNFLLEIDDNSETVKHLTLDVSNLSENQIKKYYEEVITQLTIEFQFKEGLTKYKNLSQKKRANLRKNRKGLKRFNKIHKRLWGEAIDLLEYFNNICLEAGSEFNKEEREQMTNDDFVLEVLTRLHARGTQVAYEILALLRAGFSDGAHARWRTLHEISVISNFIWKHGKDVAERYLAYEKIQSYSDAKAHRDNYRGIGEEPISDEEFEEITKIKDDFVSHFGKGFAKNYGWASSALKHPTFAAIEKNVEMEHMRPYYRMANINVHAGPKGIIFKLGHIPGKENILIAGPSIAGHADPAHGAAISLCQLTTFLLISKPTVERLVLATALQRFLDDIGETFLEVHSKIISG